jgi:hypothetical protein
MKHKPHQSTIDYIPIFIYILLLTFGILIFSLFHLQTKQQSFKIKKLKSSSSTTTNNDLNAKASEFLKNQDWHPIITKESFQNFLSQTNSTLEEALLAFATACEYYATQTPISDGSFVVGSAYQISTLGTTTNWAGVGAGNDAVLGDVFTATSVGGAGDGAAYPVGICVLSNTATPTAGNMSIAYSVGDSAAVYASYITNKWVRDWNGMTYGTYADSNFGVNIQSSENFYVANFFTDEGTVTWSGAEIINSADAQNGSLQGLWL